MCFRKKNKGEREMGAESWARVAILNRLAWKCK